MSDFEIVPRDEGTPNPKEDQPSTLSILETIAGWFGEVVLGFIKGVGMVFSGIALGAIKFTEMIVDTAKMLANGIADAILGKGGEMQEIAGAVDKKLEPYDNAITENSKYFGQLSRKVDEAIIVQEGLIEEQDQLAEQAGKYVASAEQARKELAAFEKKRQEDVRKLTEEAEAAAKDAEEFRLARVNAEKQISQEVAAALRAAESAQKSADGKSTIYYGSNTPKSPKDGDTWFKQVSGGSQILQFDGKRWVQRSDFAKFEKDLADNKSAVDQAAKDVAKAEAKVKNLVEVELPKISAGTAKFNQDLADEKKAREKALKDLDTAMGEAQKDLDELELTRPGNIFPDPFFKHPAWHSTAQPKEGGLVIPAIAPFNEPWWKGDRMVREIPVEPGASYLVTMDVKQPNSGRIIEFMTLSYHASANHRIYTKASMKKVGEGKDGAVVMSGIVTFPDTIDGRCSVAVKAFFNKGDKDVWVDNVRMVRAADNAMIIDGAVTAAKVHAGAIDTDHLAADAVKAGKIASDAVTARELKSDSVYAKHIVANQITGDHIKASQITGNHVLANSITANELQIRPGNIFPDPDFKDPCWGTSGSTYAHTNNGGELRFFPMGKQIGRYYQPAGFKDRSFMLEEGAQYRITATTWASTAALAKAKIDIYTRYYNPDGKVSHQLVGSLPVDGNGRSTPSCVITMPSDMKDGLCTLGFYINPPWNGGQISMWNVQMVRAADASLIVDGAILAKHIKAGEITSKQIAADTITGDNLKADQITGREIKSGTINASQLKVDNGWIKNAMIGNAEIEASKIKSLDAGKITTGVMDGKHVKADTITVKQLRANSIIPIGGSLIAHEPPPNDPSKPPEPIWWQALDNELRADYRGWPRPDGHPWRMANAGSYKNAKATTPKRLMRVQPGKKYRMRFWARATGPGSKMYLEMRDQNDNHAVARGTISDGQATVGKKGGWRLEDHSRSHHKNQLIWNWTVPNVPTLVETMIEFNPDVEYVYLGVLWYNDGYNRGERTTSPQNQWIAGLSIDLDVPDQAQVDAVQTKAIEANTTAIKMLGRVDIGSSLLPFVPPSEKDLADPNKKVDWTIPAWTVPLKVMGKVSLDGVERPYYGFRRPNTPFDYKELPKIPVPVNPSIPYRATAWVYSTEDYAGAWFQLGAKIAGTSADAIKEARPFNEFDRDGNRFYTGKSSKLTLRFKPDRSPRGWNKVEAQVTFKSGVESITWDDITFGNLPNYDAKGEVFFAHLQVVPDVPTQEEIDARQDIAINALADAAAANASFNKQQKNINRLVEEQLWQHQDMIELLEIRSLKQYGMRGSTSGTRTLSRPFFDAYHSSNSPNVVTVECKGNWVGTIHVLANTGGSLKGGLVDDYICNVTDNIRRFRIVGGNTVEFRHITFQVSIESLKREVILDPKNKKVIDTEGLVRSVTLTNGKTVDATGWNKTYTNVEAFRLRNGSTFRDGTGTFTYENVVGEKRTWETTSTLPSMMFPLDVFSSVNGRVTLVEADDSNKMYSVPGTKKNRPANTQTLSY